MAVRRKEEEEERMASEKMEKEKWGLVDAKREERRRGEG